jgi:hypothetical protein
VSAASHDSIVRARYVAFEVTSKSQVACRGPMPATTPNSTPQRRPRPFKTKRAELTPKQVEVLDWIENFIVPALVEKYVQERVLNQGARRG